jgi:hypothetical protein
MKCGEFLWLAENRLGYQERLCCMEWVSNYNKYYALCDITGAHMSFQNLEATSQL